MDRRMVLRVWRARGRSEAELPSDLPAWDWASWLERHAGIEGGVGDPPWLDRAVHLKDDLSLRELSEALSVPIDEISRVFRERGIRRNIPASAGASTPPPSSPSRPGSKDPMIEQYYSLLGKVPDAEVARLADVSVRTVASYRARHSIDGYAGPRRRPDNRGARQSKVDEFLDLLGKVPDRVVADIAGMSLGAVRNYRIKQDIEPVGRIPRRVIQREIDAWRRARLARGEDDPLQGVQSPSLAPPPSSLPPPASVPPLVPSGTGLRAWTVRTVGHDGPQVVLARDIASALDRAAKAAGGTDQVLTVEDAGDVVAIDA